MARREGRQRRRRGRRQPRLGLPSVPWGGDAKVGADALHQSAQLQGFDIHIGRLNAGAAGFVPDGRRDPFPDMLFAAILVAGIFAPRLAPGLGGLARPVAASGEPLGRKLGLGPGGGDLFGRAGAQGAKTPQRPLEPLAQGYRPVDGAGEATEILDDRQAPIAEARAVAICTAHKPMGHRKADLDQLAEHAKPPFTLG